MEDRKRPAPGSDGSGGGPPQEKEASVSASPSEDEGDNSNDDDESKEGVDRKMPALPSSPSLVQGVAAASDTDARAATDTSFSNTTFNNTTGNSTGNGVGSESNNNNGGDVSAASDSYPPLAIAAAAAASGGDDSESDGAKKRMRTAETEATNAAGQNRVSHEDRWIEMFNRLLAYKEENGNCRVPNRYPEDSQLGFWVSAQRRQYKIAISSTDGSSALTPERAKKLEDVGFEWSTTNPHHTPWETRYSELVEFVQKYGHAEVPMRWKENPKLSHWVSKQRHDFKLRKQGKSSRLNNKKLKLLNDVGFLWEGSRRSLKEKIAIGGSEDTGESARVDISSSQSATNPFGQPANAVVALQAAIGNNDANHAANPAFLALQQANPAAAAVAAQAIQQQPGLPPENISQILQALGIAQPVQPVFAGMPIAAPAPPVLNLASANPMQPQMPIDPNNFAAAISLVGQLLAPLLQLQQQAAQQPLPMQQLLLQILAQQQQQQQQQHQPQMQQPLQYLQLQQPQLHQQVANLAAAGNQQALTNAIQQAMTGVQSGALAFGNAPTVATAAPVVGNDSMANQLRLLQMAGFAAAPIAAAGPTPAAAPQTPPGPPGHQGSQPGKDKRDAPE